MMKLKRILAIGLSLAMTFTTTAFAAESETIKFTDIQGHWASTAIERWSEYGIMKGNEGNFRPNDAITRGEMAVILDNIFDYQKISPNSFSDLGPSYCTEAILRANAEGIILGSDGIVRPNDNITRQEAAVMFVRAFNIEKSGEELTTRYKDAGEIASWASAPAYRLEAKRYMVGSDGYFHPYNQITRGEIVQILDNAIPEIPALYDYAYIKTLGGGFPDTIEQYATEQGLTVDKFRLLCKKHATSVKEEELAAINKIRSKQLVPTADTLMQKVIPTTDMDRYLTGEFKTPKGFLSICADVNHYQTLDDLYEGLRLDYKKSPFSLNDKSYAVIRFKASNIDQAIIPKAIANGGTFTDSLPFGGMGFTSGNNERLGSPEWVMEEFTTIEEGAQIFEIYRDGREVLRGIYNEQVGRFINVREGLVVSQEMVN